MKRRWTVGGMFREVMMSRRGPCGEVKKRKGKAKSYLGKNTRKEEMSGMK